MGKPVLIAAFPDDRVAPGTAVHRLGELAPRLDRSRSLRRQVEAAMTAHTAQRYREVAELVSSVPGESPERLRALFYGMMRLTEPAGEAMLSVLPTDGLAARPAPRVAAALVACVIDGTGRSVRVERFPAEVWPYGGPPSPKARTHLVVHHGHPGRRLRRAADVLFGYATELAEESDDWLEGILREYPGCGMAAVVRRSGCLIRVRDGGCVELTGEGPADPVVFASVVHAWLAAGFPVIALEPDIAVQVNGRMQVVRSRCR